MADLQVIKTELQNDPLGRGYSGMSDSDISESLNVPNRQPNREVLTAEMLVSAIVESEFFALPARGKAYLQLLVDAGSVQLNGTVRSQLGSAFPAGSTTRANLLASVKRPGSRGEELGFGYVTPSNVANARRLP